ncbi:MAG: hypothetical protein Q8O89_00360 [Nanoarchaeota archaeon]|nr:hypothetical protein [Nanoarchaeota archaeon]
MQQNNTPATEDIGAIANSLSTELIHAGFLSIRDLDFRAHNVEDYVHKGDALKLADKTGNITEYQVLGIDSNGIALKKDNSNPFYLNSENLNNYQGWAIELKERN